MRIASFRASTFFRTWTRFGHSRTSRCFIEAVRDVVQVIVKEVRVRVESDPGGRVSEHPLHRFDVRAGTDGEAGSAAGLLRRPGADRPAVDVERACGRNTLMPSAREVVRCGRNPLVKVVVPHPAWCLSIV